MKVGFEGVKLYRYVFVMILFCSITNSSDNLDKHRSRYFRASSFQYTGAFFLSYYLATNMASD